MFDMLRESPAAAGGHKIDVEANTVGGDISDVLKSLNQKTGGQKSNKRKRNKDDILRTPSWERLILLYGYVEWSNYSNYLVEYYNQNAYKFLADAVSEQNLEDSSNSLAAVVANHVSNPPAASLLKLTLFAQTAYFKMTIFFKQCLKMEEELVCVWTARLPPELDNTSSSSTIIQSSLVKVRALASCGTEGEFSISSAVAFMCISMEADLMCELLKHGAKPIDHITQQSSAIRMCALGLVNLKGQESIASAAAIGDDEWLQFKGIAKETKMMSDWVKRQNKLLTVTSEAHELGCGVRSGLELWIYDQHTTCVFLSTRDT